MLHTSYTYFHKQCTKISCNLEMAIHLAYFLNGMTLFLPSLSKTITTNSGTSYWILKQFWRQTLIPSRNWLPSSIYELISTKMSLIFFLAWPNIFNGAVGDWRPLASRRPRDTGPELSMPTLRFTTPDISASAWLAQNQVTLQRKHPHSTIDMTETEHTTMVTAYSNRFSGK